MTESTEGVREHSFDGIQEFDNKLPNWWLWSFYLACLFSVAYWVHYHVLGTGALPARQFRLEMEAAEARLTSSLAGAEVTDELLTKLASEPTVVEKGRQIFVANCATCHKEDAGGNVGPNLTDRYWIHGAAPTDLYKVVTKGVLEKGMLSWEPVLGTTRCQQVVAFLLDIKNTEVAGGKEPQGELEQ